MWSGGVIGLLIDELDNQWGLVYPRGELDNQIHVIGLGFGFVGGFVAHCRAATLAFVDYNVAALGVGLGFYRAEYSAAFVCSIARIYIHV